MPPRNPPNNNAFGSPWDAMNPGSGTAEGNVTGGVTGDSQARSGELLRVVRSCLGAPYRYFNDGGDGRSNTSVADVLRNGESCTGIFVFACLQIGVEPPFVGTYDAEQTLRGEGGETFDPDKEYPIGTFIVGVAPGTEGHLMMVSGAGNTVIESSTVDGVNEGKNARDVANPGYNIDTAVAGTFKSLGTGPIERGDITNPLNQIAEGIAQGIAKAFVRILRIVYAVTILWPLDFVSGFWWEITKQLTGAIAEFSEKIDLLAILKGEDVEIPEYPPIIEGDLFSEENRNRFYWLVFFLLTYQIAFGFDRNNNSHLDNVMNAGDSVGLGVDKGKKGYNETASITALVSRRAGQEPELAENIKQINSNKRGGAKNGRNVKRDGATGKFKKA